MKVLIAVDGSSYAAAAAEFVRALPARAPMDVTLVTVVNPPDVALSTSTEMWYPQYVEHQQEYAEETLSGAAARFDEAGMKVNRHITQGHIGHAIVDQADQMGADLVVVGAKGHTAIGRILLGSVSDYVATHATCSVVVIRPRPEDHAEHPRKISIAFDGSPPAQTALNDFLEFDWPADEQIQVITASPKLEVFREDILASVLEEGARRRSEALRTANAGAKQLTDRGLSAVAESIEVEHIGEGILQAADAFGSDLIVVGDAGRGTVTRWLLGSTSRYVLRHADQSVWVVRHRKEAES